MTKKAPPQPRSTDRADRWNPPAGCRITRSDLSSFRKGIHSRLYDFLGAHRSSSGGVDGVSFAVWAPNARKVSVVGDFNGWNPEGRGLTPLRGSGIWAGFVPGLQSGAVYKYRIESRLNDYVVDKADPFAFKAEIPPETASILWDLDYTWGDREWMAARADKSAPDAPMSIYELHLGSWKRPSDDPGRMFGYRELADELIPYLEQMGFTHVEFLPPMEHPFYGSWGYQTTGYFAASSRFGSPQDLMYLIDRLHRHGIGVIMDWVPSHFPTDEHGLGFFDGTHLFEHADPRQGYHPDWRSFIFNYGRKRVRSFLISSATFWLDRYHVDAIRVDAVASMLYRDYSRDEGEWIPNQHGGRENLEAIVFLKELNRTIHERFPDVRTIAEESTAWPLVSRPIHVGGLGFDMKWDMGWMHDTLEYMKLDPIHRHFHHEKLTFRVMYAFAENFVLALSHDEVVHGKASLIGKMSGDEWQRFANLRTLYGYMFAQPGKKLLFMGGEFGQWREWDHDRGLDWDLVQYPLHAGLQRWVQDLNAAYRGEPALHAADFSIDGFEWIDCHDAAQSVLSMSRKSPKGGDPLLIVCNFTPVPRENYRVGVPAGGRWVELLNSDSERYGGSGVGNMGSAEAVAMRYHDRPFSLNLTLPPLGVLLLKREAD